MFKQARELAKCLHVSESVLATLLHPNNIDFPFYEWDHMEHFDPFGDLENKGVGSYEMFNKNIDKFSPKEQKQSKMPQKMKNRPFLKKSEVFLIFFQN